MNVQGVLSLFCVLKAGAAHVIAIEASTMATVCKEMAAVHGISDRITVVNARVEDLRAQLPGLPPGCSGADVIVSEWMGTVRSTTSTAQACLLRDSRLRMMYRDWLARVCWIPSCTRATCGSSPAVAYFPVLRVFSYQAGSTLPLQSYCNSVSAPLRGC